MDCLPLCSSLERQQWTLQRLNSSSEELDGSLSPGSTCSSNWSTDSLDDEAFLDYLFSQGLADAIEKPNPTTPEIISKCSPQVSAFCDNYCASVLSDKDLQDFCADCDNMALLENAQEDLVVLGVDLNNLLDNTDTLEDKLSIDINNNKSNQNIPRNTETSSATNTLLAQRNSSNVCASTDRQFFGQQHHQQGMQSAMASHAAVSLLHSNQQRAIAVPSNPRILQGQTPSPGNIKIIQVAMVTSVSCL